MRVCVSSWCVRVSGWVGALALVGLGAVQAQTLSLGAATGATVQPLLGVNIGPGPQGEAGNADLAAAYRERGVGLVRTHDYYGPLDMATLYPDRSKDPLVATSYNFSGVLDLTYRRSSDSVFNAIVDGGFEPYFRLGDSYNNVNPPTPAQLSNWVQAAVQVLRHYREGQWGGRVSSFRYVEIGNEPDNAQFWPAPRTTAEFNQLYEQTAKALRSAFPSLKLGGPGWAPSGCLAPDGQAKVRSLLDHVKSTSAPMDFMSFHVYNSDPAVYASCAQFYRNELDTRGLQSVALHITEWNTPNGSAGSAVGQLRYNAEGAARMTAAWTALQNNGVSESTVYRGSDPSPTAPEFYGIFYADGRAKKVGDAFRLWRLFTAYPSVLASTGAPTGVSTLAAQTATGAKAVLLANTGTTATTHTLSLPDSTPWSAYVASLLTVNEAGEGVVSSALASASFSLPGKTSALLQLVPRSQAFGVTAQPSGGASALSLGLQTTVAAQDVGRSGQVYVAALVAGQWYAWNGRGWALWSSGELPAAFTGLLPPTLTLNPLSAQDVRGLSGVPLYVGYGTSTQDMLSQNRYRLAYTLP